MSIVLTDEQRQLAEDNKRLVYWVASKYSHIPPHVYEDLLFRLFHRLCVSVSRFDPSRGFKISTFLVRTLKGEVKNFFRDDIWIIKPPRKLRGKNFARMISRVESPLSEAEILGQNPESVRTCALPVSLSTLSEQEEPYFNLESTVIDRIGGNEIVDEVFRHLKPEEQYILDIIMNGGSIHDIQDELGISRVCAARIVSEVQENARSIYISVCNNENIEQSPGSKTLDKLFIKRFVPPNMSIVDVRRKAVKSITDEEENNKCPPNSI